MKDSSMNSKPYQQLGEQLRHHRISTKESIAEACNALELEERALERYESGLDRPDEDLLYMLINHYRLQERNANQLWELAGYQPHFSDDELLEEAMSAAKQLIMVIASDNRSLYTDGLNIDCTKTGIQLCFTQSVGQNKTINVARLGMSFEQAQQVIKGLSVALTYAKFTPTNLLLPPGK